MRLKQTVIKTRCHWVAPRGLWEAQAVCLEMGPVRFSEGRVTAMPSGYSAGGCEAASLLDQGCREIHNAIHLAANANSFTFRPVSLLLLLVRL